jgi:hypothetical protein
MPSCAIQLESIFVKLATPRLISMLFKKTQKLPPGAKLTANSKLLCFSFNLLFIKLFIKDDGSFKPPSYRLQVSLSVHSTNILSG